MCIFSQTILPYKISLSYKVFYKLEQIFYCENILKEKFFVSTSYNEPHNNVILTIQSILLASVLQSRVSAFSVYRVIAITIWYDIGISLVLFRISWMYSWRNVVGIIGKVWDINYDRLTWYNTSSNAWNI